VTKRSWYARERDRFVTDYPEGAETPPRDGGKIDETTTKVVKACAWP
jgi:hypothetical protein